MYIAAVNSSISNPTDSTSLPSSKFPNLFHRSIHEPPLRKSSPLGHAPGFRRIKHLTLADAPLIAIVDTETRTTAIITPTQQISITSRFIAGRETDERETVMPLKAVLLFV